MQPSARTGHSSFPPSSSSARGSQSPDPSASSGRPPLRARPLSTPPLSSVSAMASALKPAQRRLQPGDRGSAPEARHSRLDTLYMAYSSAGSACRAPGARVTHSSRSSQAARHTASPCAASTAKGVPAAEKMRRKLCGEVSAATKPLPTASASTASPPGSACQNVERSPAAEAVRTSTPGWSPAGPSKARAQAPGPSAPIRRPGPASHSRSRRAARPYSLA
mmetsp:Transcript_101036/g.274621  ORF Transcript_101036/g.274621 Transcript_101036/m.274621 type:complete len:221 (+) Transcript_101036:345-1007(+)